MILVQAQLLLSQKAPRCNFRVISDQKLLSVGSSDMATLFWSVREFSCINAKLATCLQYRLLHCLIFGKVSP